MLEHTDLNVVSEKLKRKSGSLLKNSLSARWRKAGTAILNRRWLTIKVTLLRITGMIQSEIRKLENYLKFLVKFFIQ